MSTWNLDKVEKIAKIFSLLAMPILLGLGGGLGGYYLQNIISKRATNVAYTELAISILKEDADKKENYNLRGWAISVLRKTSPVDITEELGNALKDGTVTFPEFSFFQLSKLGNVAPSYLIECARENTVEIPQGELSRAQTAELLARIRVSELAKSRCAEGWASWFSSLVSK